MIGKNDLHLVSRAALSPLRGGPAPFKLTVAVTYECHQRCTHCRIWKRGRTDELDVGQWRRVWRSAADTLAWLDLTGGELTSRPDAAEIAIAALEEVPRLALLHFPTNGTDPDAVVRLATAVLTARPHRLIVSISLDGPPALHDRLRGDLGSFDRAIETYRRLRALNVEAYFGMTLSSWNLDALDATAEALAARSPGFLWSDLHVNLLHESPHYFGNDGIKHADPAATRAAIQTLLERRGAPRRLTHVLEHLFLQRLDEYTRTGRSPLPCGALKGHAFIDPTGTVFPCHIWARPVGLLRDHAFSLPAVLGTAASVEARARVTADLCPGCWTPCEAYPTILENLLLV